MNSMTPGLIEAGGNYAKRTGRALSGLIVESLAEKMKRKASLPPVVKLAREFRRGRPGVGHHFSRS
jgi:hypothetical protein